MKLYSKRIVFAIILVLQEFMTSSFAILYIVRQDCVRGTVFTPNPATTANICLQCKCIMNNISYCKLLAVQLSTICSAAIVTSVVAATTTAAPTIPTVPATGTGINPRASPAPMPAAAMMMNAGATVMMVTVPPMMMAMMMAGMAGAAAPTMAPAAGGMIVARANATAAAPPAAG